MQIRLAVKQDEKQLREIFQENTCQNSLKIYSQSQENSDLQNIERHYFGQAGLFLVMEEDKEIKAAMGASKSAENILQIRRYFARDKKAEKALASMLEICLQHALQMDFQKLECPDDLAGFRAQDQP